MVLTSYSMVVRRLKHVASWTGYWLACQTPQVYLLRPILNARTTKRIVVMGKCKFSDNWLEDPTFKDCLRPVVGNNRQAHCSVCIKNINIRWMGVNALRSRMQSISHKSGMRGRGEQLSVSTFCAAATITPPQTSATIQTNISATLTADPWVTTGAKTNTVRGGSVVSWHWC